MKEAQSTFEFVSVVPTKDGRAKPNRQAVVRKNAARYQWRKNRETKELSTESAVSTPTPGADDSGVELEEVNSRGVARLKQVTGPRHRSHGPSPTLQTNHLSSKQDGKIAQIMAFSTFVHF
jgi:hypothetical protein